jgi:RNA polymerase sigma-70 factor, ECF subfamily
LMWMCKRPECNCDGNQRNCLSGDQASAKALVKTLTPMVEAIVKKKLPFSQPEDRADVRQETFLRVFRSLGGWKGECPFCLWVKQVAIRACYDQSRRDRRLKRIRTATGDPDLEVDPKTRPLSPEVWKCIEQKVERLPDGMRRAYELHMKQGMPIEETAKTVGTSVRTIYNWLDRIKAGFLSCLD